MYESGSSIFLDLGDSTWRAIEIQATGWRVVESPTFISGARPASVRFPVPARDGSIGLLRKYINVEPADLPLLIGWLTAALRPTGPHPILVVTGEQGSAKSTLARICRLLVDPHSAPLRAEPKLVLDSSFLNLDVSPFAMDQRSPSSGFHGATFR